MTVGGMVALPAVHDTGSGPALVFLHAFPLDSSQWDHQVASLSGQFRCVRVDMWGCGMSAAPVGEPSLAAFARSVLQALDTRGIDRFIACGCSMGGYVVWELLRVASDRVMGLALCSTRATADPDPARAGREDLARRVVAAGIDAIVEDNVDRLLSVQSRSEPHITDPIRGRIRRCSPEGVAWALRAMAARPDSTALLPAIRVPTLVVAGSDDRAIPSDLQRAMAALIPGATYEQFEGCGHLPNLEDNAHFSDTLAGFVATLR